MKKLLSIFAVVAAIFAVSCGVDAATPSETVVKFYELVATGEYEAAVEHLKAKLPGVEIVACETPEIAVKDADIVCTVTSTKSDAPFLKGEWLKEGAHLNAVGACSGSAREIETSVVQRCKVYYDWEEATMRDAGDLVIPLNKGEVSKSDFMGEIGSVMLGKLEGRANEQEITMFETIGISVEDIAAAYQIYEKAKEQNLGVWLEI